MNIWRKKQQSWIYCMLVLLLGGAMVFPQVGYEWFTYALVGWMMALFFLQKVGLMWYVIGAVITVVVAGASSALTFRSWQDFVACAALILVVGGITGSFYRANKLEKLIESGEKPKDS